MPVDFRDAAERHWEDAGHLLAESHTANADHLFGLSAECALKAVMIALGMPVRQDGAPRDRQHRIHINELWNEFISFANARSGARYAIQISSIANPFTNWDISQRYNHRSDFTAAVVEDHHKAARMAKQALDNAILNGEIP